MPSKKVKSSLARRLGEGARNALLEHKDEEVQYDQSAGLPAGIEGGIARLVDCKFTVVKEGKQNAGKDMFYAAAIVVSPEEFNGINLVGLRTQISEPLYETPTRSRKTVEDHVLWVQNEFKKLGAVGESLELENLESTAEAMREMQPYLRFRTWSGDKTEIVQRGGKWFAGTKGPYATEAACKASNPFAGREPMVSHVWGGSCDYTEDGVDSEVVDDTAQAEEVEQDVETQDVDLSELASQADAGDDAAATELSRLAMEAGVEEDAINGAESWADVVDMIEGDDEKEEEEEEEEEEDEWAPAKGEVYPYKAPGKKKAVDCEVTAVFGGSQKVNIKNLTDGKTYKSVPWGKLIRED